MATNYKMNVDPIAPICDTQERLEDMVDLIGKISTDERVLSAAKEIIHAKTGYEMADEDLDMVRAKVEELKPKLLSACVIDDTATQTQLTSEDKMVNTEVGYDMTHDRSNVHYIEIDAHGYEAAEAWKIHEKLHNEVKDCTTKCRKVFYLVVNYHMEKEYGNDAEAEKKIITRKYLYKDLHAVYKREPSVFADDVLYGRSHCNADKKFFNDGPWSHVRMDALPSMHPNDQHLSPLFGRMYWASVDGPNTFDTGLNYRYLLLNGRHAELRKALEMANCAEDKMFRRLIIDLTTGVKAENTDSCPRFGPFRGLYHLWILPHCTRGAKKKLLYHIRKYEKWEKRQRNIEARLIVDRIHEDLLILSDDAFSETDSDDFRSLPEELEESDPRDRSPSPPPFGASPEEMREWERRHRPVQGEAQGLLDFLKPSVVHEHVVKMPQFEQLKTLLANASPTEEFAQKLVGTLAALQLYWSTDRSWVNFASVLTNVFVGVWRIPVAKASAVVSSIADPIKKFGQWLITPFFPQGENEDDLEDKPEGWIARITSSILCTLTGQPDLSRKSFLSLLGNIALIGRAITGTEKIFDTISRVVNSTVEFVRVKVLGFSPNLSNLDKVRHGISEWADEAHDLLTTDDIHTKIKTDIVMCDRVHQCYTTGVGLKQQLVREPEVKQSVYLFQNLFVQIAKLEDEIEVSPVYVKKQRAVPVCIHFTGGTKTGKSTLVRSLIIEACAKYFNPKNWKDELYVRNTAQEFWDGYVAQFVTWYDDFLQRKDTTTNPSEELLEVIRTHNIASFPLHMAGLSEKAITQFVSKLIILTSNKIGQLQSITCPAAFRRRRDKLIEVSIKKQYQGDDGLLDPSKVEGAMNTDIYLFTVLNPVDEKPTGQVLTWAELVNEVRGLLDARQEDFKEYIGSLDKLADSMYTKVWLKNNPEEKTVPKMEAQGLTMSNPPQTEVVRNEPFWDDYADVLWRMGTLDLVDRKPSKEELEIARLRNVATISLPMADPKEKDKVQEPVKMEPQGLGWLFATPAEPESDDDDSDDEDWPEIDFEISNCVIPKALMEDYPNQNIKILELKEPHDNMPSIYDLYEKYGDISSCIDALDPHDPYGWATAIEVISKKFDVAKVVACDIIAATIGHGHLHSRGHLFFHLLGHFAALDAEPSKSKDEPKTKKVSWISKTYTKLKSSLGSFFTLAKRIMTTPFFMITGAVALGLLSLKWYWPEVYEDKKEQVKQKCVYLKEWFKSKVRPDNLTLGHMTPCDEQCDVCDEILPVMAHSEEERGAVVCEGILKRIKREGLMPPPLETIDHVNAPESGKYAHKHECTSCKSLYEHKHAKPLSFDRHSLHCPECRDRAEGVYTSDTTNKIGARPTKAVAARQEGCIDESSYQVANSVASSNLFRIRVIGQNEEKGYSMNAFFVRGTTALVPNHLSTLIEGCRKVELFAYTSRDEWEKYEFTPDQIHITEFDSAHTRRIDASLMTFSSPDFQSRKDMLKHFMTKDELSRLSSDQVLLAIRGTEGNTIKYPTGMINNRHMSVEYDSLTGITYSIPNTISYTVPTQRGDCGAPCFVLSNGFPSKIFGMHVCGTPYGGANAQPLDRESIYAHLPAPHGAVEGVELVKEAISLNPPPPLVQEIDPDKEPLMPPGAFKPVGVNGTHYSSGSKTQIRKSPLHNVVTRPVTQPAKLRPFMKDGDLLDPIMMGLKKAGGTDKPVDPFHLSMAKSAVLAKLASCIKRPPRVLTKEEAIKGNEDMPYVNSMNRRTSAGYQWSKMTDKPGKTEWLGDDQEFIVDHPDLDQALQARLEAAKRGEKLLTIWIDTLKDERRPTEKVQAGKTRVFSAGQMDFLVATRMYFLDVIAQLTEANVSNEIAVGVDVFGYDVNRIVTHVTKFGEGKRFIAGDFSNFDGTLNAEIVTVVMEILSELYYDASYEDDRVRKVIADDIIHSIHLNGENVYQWTHSNPSGNPMTTPINCIYQMLTARLVWLSLIDQDLELDNGKWTSDFTINDFDDHVAALFYGDDNLIGVSDEVKSWYNQETLTREYEKLGMVYTDETKTGKMHILRSFEEISFLKRAFRYDLGRHSWVMPREINSVLETLNWVKGQLQTSEITRMNVEQVAMELSLHPRRIFESWIPRITLASRKLLGTHQPLILNYSSYQRLDLTRHLQWI